MMTNIAKKIKYNFEKKFVKLVLDKNLFQKVDPKLHISMLIFGSLFSQLFRSGMVLGLYDALDEREGQTLDQLSDNLKIEYYPLEILLKSLEYAQVIIKIGDKYFNSPTVTFMALEKNEKLFALRTTMEYFNHVVDPSFSVLPSSIRENKPKGLNKMFGDNCSNFYEAISEEPARNKYFSDFMQGFTNLNKDQVTSESIFSKCKNLLDVGGNTGEIALALGKRNPNIKVTVLDFQEVIKLAQKRFEENNLSDRLKVYSGNALKEIPTGYDCMLLFHFIDIFSPEENRIILRNVYNALPEGGTICIFTPITYSNKRSVNDLMGNYFLNLANGKGAFYEVNNIIEWLEDAKFVISSKKYYPFNEIFIVANKYLS